MKFWSNAVVHSRTARLLRFLVLAMLVAITLGLPMLSPEAHRIDVPHFRLINSGMTQQEVERVFGKSPTAEQYWAIELSKRLATPFKDSSKDLVQGSFFHVNEKAAEYRYWTSSRGSFCVGFRDGRVVALFGWENTFWDNLQDSWRRLFR